MIVVCVCVVCLCVCVGIEEGRQDHSPYSPNVCVSVCLSVCLSVCVGDGRKRGTGPQPLLTQLGVCCLVSINMAGRVPEHVYKGLSLILLKCTLKPVKIQTVSEWFLVFADTEA